MIDVTYPESAKREHELMHQRKAFYNEALDWAAGFVIHSVSETDDEKVKEFAQKLYSGIKANKREVL